VTVFVYRFRWSRKLIENYRDCFVWSDPRRELKAYVLENIRHWLSGFFALNINRMWRHCLTVSKFHSNLASVTSE
jgi:hypothetical protein